MAEMYEHEIRQGAVYWLALDYYECDHDKLRPWMVVSNEGCNRRSGDINVVPLSTSIKRMDLPCNVEVGRIIDPDHESIAKCSMLRTVRREQLTAKNWAGQAGVETIEKVIDGIKAQTAVWRH